NTFGPVRHVQPYSVVCLPPALHVLEVRRRFDLFKRKNIVDLRFIVSICQLLDLIVNLGGALTENPIIQFYFRYNFSSARLYNAYALLPLIARWPLSVSRTFDQIISIKFQSLCISFDIVWIGVD